MQVWTPESQTPTAQLPSADAYAQAVAFARQSDRLYEVAPTSTQLPRELELQARWYHGEFGSQHVTEDSTPVEVLYFGEWNREAGPDFCNAILRFGNNKPIRGDIEVDLEPEFWELHGHRINPRFDRTILHLCFSKRAKRFFTRTSNNQFVPQVILPFPIPCPPQTPWQQKEFLCNENLSRLSEILCSAAWHRFQKKAEAFQRARSIHGQNHTLFWHLARTLGYRDNTIPFMALAQRAGITASKGARGEALLFGLAGFLEAKELTTIDNVACRYLRQLWDQWWIRRAELERLILPAKAWEFGSSRPSNHPHRRIAALAGIATKWKSIFQAVQTSSASAFTAHLNALQHPFWNYRFSFEATPLKRPVALLGQQRIQDMLINVFYPSQSTQDLALWEQYKALTTPSISGKIRRITEHLAGPTATTPSFLSLVVHQQGILQIYHDLQSCTAPHTLIESLNTL